MTPEIEDYFTTTIHRVCITNRTKDRFLSISTTGLRWTDNFNFASCFENEQEALEYAERPYVQDFIGDEPEQYIWTDSRKSVFEE